MQDAAKELGNVKVTTDGPTEAKIDEQIKFIDNYITRGVDGVLFAANDPVAIAPVLKKALAKGIHVVGYDANSDARRPRMVRQPGAVQRHRQGDDRRRWRRRSARTRASPSSPAPSPRPTRPAGSPRCGPTPPSAIPKMKWLETVEAQEDNILSFNQASTLINKYGDKLAGLFGMTSVATPASAEAVTQAKLCGKVAVVGLATPNAMKPYVEVGLREVGGAVEPGRSRLCRGLRHARRGRRQAEAGRRRRSTPASSASCRWSTAAKSCSARRSSTARTTSTTSTSECGRTPARPHPPIAARWAPPSPASGRGVFSASSEDAEGECSPPLPQAGEGFFLRRTRTWKAGAVPLSRKRERGFFCVERGRGRRVLSPSPACGRGPG